MAEAAFQATHLQSSSLHRTIGLERQFRGRAVRQVENVLLCTGSLRDWRGSEIVVSEIAEGMAALGHRVTVFAHVTEPPIRSAFEAAGVRLTTDPSEVDLAGQDLIYIQHQVAVPFVLTQIERLRASQRPFPFVVFAHLSPFALREAPGPLIEPQVSDLVLANSQETRARLLEINDCYASSHIFPNPAPDAFFQRRGPSADLRRLLIVSNHANDEMLAAIPRLEGAGVAVSHVGLPANNRRIAPEDIMAHDAVMTIGKTVQYALACRTPVFCYDYFGGPGWIDEQNFLQAQTFNFSGRSHPVFRTDADLAKDVLQGFRGGQAFAQGIADDRLAEWRLSSWIDRLLAAASSALDDPQRSEARRALLASARFRQDLEAERALHQWIENDVRLFISRTRPERKPWYHRVKRAVRATARGARQRVLRDTEAEKGQETR